jgi:hypothetical protein
VKGALATTIAAWLIASAPLLALDFWEAKDFSTWSGKEVAKMLSDSPWSHAVVIVTPDLSLSSRVGGLSGGVVGNGVGRSGRAAAGGGVGGDGAGNLGGGSFLAPPERTRLVVRWASAVPVKQALARKHSGDGAEASDPQQTQDSGEFYRLEIAGIPFGQAVATAVELQEMTFLKRKNGEPIRPATVSFSYENDLLTIEFSFARTETITLEDREIQFSTRLGTSELKTKFTLKDMVIANRLAL